MVVPGGSGTLRRDLARRRPSGTRMMICGAWQDNLIAALSASTCASRQFHVRHDRDQRIKLGYQPGIGAIVRHSLRLRRSVPASPAQRRPGDGRRKDRKESGHGQRRRASTGGTTRHKYRALESDRAALGLAYPRPARTHRVGCPASSYLFHLGPAAAAGVTLDQARDRLVAVAPIVGTPLTAVAAAKIAEALALAIDLSQPDPDT
jgi:hypothetical protein